MTWSSCLLTGREREQGLPNRNKEKGKNSFTQACHEQARAADAMPGQGRGT